MKKRGVISSIIVAIVMIVSSMPYIPMEASAASNEQVIFDYLTGKLGFNSAAACAVLANIGEESNFNPTKTEGGNGAGYGLCQWTGSRRTDLTTWCSDNNYDYTTINGQLNFLNHELKEDYSSVYNALRGASNTADGSYEAAKVWCMDFEKPEYRNKVHGQYDANGNSVKNGGYDKFNAYNGKVYKCISARVDLTESEYRGYLAKTKYWPKYGGDYPPDSITDDELGIPYPRPTGSPLLRKGSKGDYVGWLQYSLHEKLGYDIGASGVDCDFGSATDAAVREFQSDYGLDVDGLVGPATVNELVEAIFDPGECKLVVASDYITINKNIDQKVSVDCTYYNTRRDVTNVTLQYSCEQKNALNLSWGEWSGRTCPLIIYANSIGTVKVTVNLLNSANDEVLVSKDITVVSRGDTAVNMSATSLTLNLDKNETTDIVATVKCFPRDGKLEFTEATEHAKVSVIDKKIEDHVPIITFKVEPRAAGTTDLHFYIKSGTGTTLAEAVVYVNVVLDTKTVSFDPNGGKCLTTEKTVKYNSIYGSLPVPTKEGFTFDGWYTAKDGGTLVTSDTKVANTSNHTLYAHWTGIDVDIMLIDEVNETRSEFISRYGETFNVSMMKRAMVLGQTDPTADKLFIGWSAKPDGEVIMKSGSIIKPVSGQKTGSLTLYARWISPKLSLKVNGQESYEALPGETVNVTLEIEGAENAYSTLQTKYSFSTSLIKSGESVGMILPLTSSTGEGIVSIAGAASGNYGTNGVIYSCNYTIPENAPRGSSYPFEFVLDNSFALNNVEGDSNSIEMQKYAASHCTGCIVNVNEFSINETELTLTNGEQYLLAMDEEGVTFSSNNQKVAVVSANGLITAVDEGTAKISVISSDFEVVQIEVTVTSSEIFGTDTPLYGDVNLDGKVTAADATAIMQYIANRDKYALSEQSLVNADVYGNGDGITAMDALMIQQVDSGFITAEELAVN